VEKKGRLMKVKEVRTW